MTIFISNPTTQNWHFHFRMPTNNLLSMIEIPHGQQREIGHGWSPEQTEMLVKQLQKMGGREADDTYGHMGKFMGLLYRVDNQVEEDEIVTANVAVNDTAGERSVAQATKGALAFDRAANSRLRGRRAARATEVQVEQLLAPGARPTGNEVNFGLGVDPDGRADANLPA